MVDTKQDVNAFIAELGAMEGYEIQRYFDDEYDGCCPCFAGVKEIGSQTLGVWGRCWRVSRNDQDLHIGGTLTRTDLERIAIIIKSKLDEQEWYNPYTIIYDNSLADNLKAEEEELW